MPIASVFLRPDGASGAGHVGFAFEHSEGKSIVGALENMHGGPINDPQHATFCHRLVKNSKVMNYFRAMDYQTFKSIEVPPEACSVEGALAAVKRWEDSGYNVLTRNCLHATHDVLTGYGAALPKPDGLLRIPNEWYKRLPGRSEVVVPDFDMFTRKKLTKEEAADPGVELLPL